MSRFWNNHPELYEEIIIKEMIRRGLATVDEEPDAVLKRWEERDDDYIIAQAAEADYEADKIDEAWERYKERGLK